MYFTYGILKVDVKCSKTEHHIEKTILLVGYRILNMGYPK